MITNYGSDTNGLTNTLAQIFRYVALLEAGIGQSTRNALYKPLAGNDHSDKNVYVYVFLPVLLGLIRILSWDRYVAVIASFSLFVFYGTVTFLLIFIIFCGLAYVVDKETFRMLIKKVGGRAQ